MVSRGKSWASPALLKFRDPESFVAGNIHSYRSTWECIANLPGNTNPHVLGWISEGIDIQEFVNHFSGNFQGRRYDSDFPPRASFPNSKSCDNFAKFISETILGRVRNGSLIIWGEVGEVEPPHLVMPITIEPNKPRMCHDERLLNCWIKDCPFSLDYITDLPRYVGLDHFQTTFDDKSGYDHVRLHPASRKYFGLEWSGWYFVYSTLPFGWKASAYIYNSIGLVATSFIRSLGVPCSQYIDDRHVGQLRLPQNSTCRFSGYQLAEMASFIACSVLLSLGYFIGLKKSVLVPQTVIRFLGYLCNSHKQAFILPEDKRLKFSTLRESILENKSVSLKNLQKFTGKTTSFALLVPAAKLFSNNAYQAISRAQKSSSTSIRLSDPLRNEILHWRFLDSWSGFLPWKEEKHVCVSVHSDASNTGWGGVLSSPGQPTQEIRGYWDEESRRFPIAVKEAKALLATLQSLLQGVYNVRLDVFVDNKVVVDSWNRQTSKSPSITGVMKDLFAFSTKHNISLSVQFVPSKLNIADSLSRTVSDLDCTLSPTAWRTIESAFGPHSIDLMALPDNVRCNAAGRPLRFLSPFPCAGSSGVNVFAQPIPVGENAYLFPPFTLIGPLLKHLQTQGCPFSMVVPDLSPRRYWWPLLTRSASSCFKLGVKGDPRVLLFPSKASNVCWEPRPLPWDLWVFRIPNYDPLPQVPRLWVPAVQCPLCAYPNDASFLFCQRCGYARKPLGEDSALSKLPLNLPEIESRLDDLRAVNQGKPYQKQKSKLHKDIECFLFSLPTPKPLSSATPNDIIRFLVWKDRSGKTKIHVPSCPWFGSRSPDQCLCPARLAAGTVDSVIGKLRSLFADLGRGGEWNDLLGMGNPASHKTVKQYLKSIQEEQAIARVSPKTSDPSFP
ncbi:hypothetical protein QZH41_009488 [Actinostola sp. cb2023]|nr:hypothetical protein QZH41_009488 [Actinostola sp. cb2023]